MQFRKDINGIRAIAVIAVVLYHFNENWLPGGFAGVDVFFVISGFLMTKIIFTGIEQNNFSILEFYVARANRIIPPLAILCLIMLVFGWFYLTPLDYMQLGKHTAGSITFLSNFLYWTEAGYFDTSSHEKWLLHTWSLSAEWQFYIIFPLILITIKKLISIQNIRPFVLFSMILGFIYSAYITPLWPDSSYYLLATRAWEMLAGGVAFLYPLRNSENTKKLFYWIGLLLILMSYIFVSKENLWPGHLAAIPVIGTLLMICANRENSFVTSNFVFQKIGSWSYSIYLWHWPFVVLISYYALSESFIFLGIALSIICGQLSYKYVEGLRFRRNFKNIWQLTKCVPLYFSIIIALLGTATYLTQGFSWHYSDEIRKASNEALNKNPYNCMTENKFPCIIGNSNNIKAIIVGDSHADALTSSLAHSFDLNVNGIIALNKSSCPFILGVKTTLYGEECLIENQKRLTYLKENYSEIPVFWVARSSVYLYGQSNPARIKNIFDTQPLIYFSDESYEVVTPQLFNELELALVNTLNQINSKRKVYLLLPIPEMRVNVPKSLSKSLMMGENNKIISIDKKQYFDRNGEVIKLLKKMESLNSIFILDPTKYLCDLDKCYGQYNGRPLYYDGDHLSEFGNKKLTPMFKIVIN